MGIILNIQTKGSSYCVTEQKLPIIFVRMHKTDYFSLVLLGFLKQIPLKIFSGYVKNFWEIFYYTKYILF